MKAVFGRPFTVGDTMSKKISFGLALAMCILCISATFAVTMIFSKSIYNSIITNLSLRTSASVALEEINEIVSNYFYGTVDDKTLTLTSSVVEGYVNGLGDSNSTYLTSEEFADYTTRLEGNFTGIGIETEFNSIKRQLNVAWVYEGSPAETSGLKQGDIIEEIDGVEVTYHNYEKLSEKLNGGKLSGVEIVYNRDGDRNTVEPMMGFDIPTVTAKTLSGSIAYIRITAFYKDTPSEFKARVEEMQKGGVVGFIIDLRGTSEGTLEYAAQTLDVLVPAPSGSQNLAATYDKNGNRLNVYTAESGSVNSTYAVLVNSRTAGPAELFACDLRDISGAKLVGSETKGICTVQRAFPLENGEAVLLTVARIEPFNPEHDYNETGLIPDCPCDMTQGESVNLWTLPVSEDAQLTQAASLLK